MKTFLQILGVALVVLGGQGLVRLLVDHSNYGIFGWLSHDFVVLLVTHTVVVVMGGALAAWATKK